MTSFPFSLLARKNSQLTWLLALTITLLAGCAAAPPPQEQALAAAKRTPEQQAGIRIIGVRQASAGYMLDFRYVVEEPLRAGALFDRAVIPYLIHEASGARFMVPNPAKVGPLRATSKEPTVGKQYYIFFANPGRYVKPGDQVTVVVGRHRFEHLAVR